MNFYLKARAFVNSNSVSCPVIITLLLYSSFMFVKLAKSDFDFSVFVVAGDRFVDVSNTPTRIHVLPDSDGYDGQFYYRLALDPFTNEATKHGVTLDVPAKRQQRIAYPLLVWLFTTGDSRFVPAALVLINLLAVTGTALVAALLLRSLGRRTVLACFFSCYPGFVVSFAWDMAEILAVFWVLLGLYACLRRRFLLGAITLSIGVMTRETTLLVPAGIGIALGYQHARGGDIRCRPWPLFLLPLLTYLVIQYLATLNWGTQPISGSLVDLDWPFRGIVYFVRENIDFGRTWESLGMVSFSLCVGVLALGSMAVKTSTVESHVKISWVLYVVLVICLSANPWVRLASFMRAFAETYALSMLIVLGAKCSRKMLLALFVYMVLTWLSLSWLFGR